VLARNLRRLRLERGLSQENLAAEAVIRQALVSAIEAGSSNPTLDSLSKLARALQVDFVELFDASRK
jgi:transcriptional regulator with XRE-family HTH domain